MATAIATSIIPDTLLQRADGLEAPVAPESEIAAEPERPSHEAIALRAYECWLERGCPDGSPEVDWLRAEQEVNGPNAAA
jgi:hypothetical protein